MSYLIAFTGSEPRPGNLLSFNFEVGGKAVTVVTKVTSRPGEPAALLNDWIECAEAWLRFQIDRHRYNPVKGGEIELPHDLFWEWKKTRTFPQ